VENEKAPQKVIEKWRYVLLIILCFLTYTATYVGKYSYAANINYVIDHFTVSLSDAGLVETCLFIAYGAGQILNGIFCRFYNVKWSIFGGLALIFSLNFIIPFVPFSAYAPLWALMGVGASFLWTSLVRLMSDNLPGDLLDAAILVMSAPVALGTIIIYGVGAGFASASMDSYLFYFAGGFVLLIALAWICLLPLTKATTKPLPILKSTSETPTKGKSPWKSYLFFFIVIALASVTINFAKDGAQTWIPKVLKDSYGYSNATSNLFTMILPLAGVLGAFLAVFLHKKLKDFIGLTLVFLFLSAVALGLIYFFYLQSAALLIACMACLSCFMYAANNVVTNMVPLYLRDKFPSGLLAGLIDGLCYVGSAFSSFGLGAISDQGGWGSVFLSLWIAVLAVSGLSALYVLLSHLVPPREKDEKKTTSDSSSPKS
jgi:sugar phosphate permease